MEAQTAEAIFLQFHENIYACFEQIASGRELIEAGFADDVRLAAELNVSDVAPRLLDYAYRSVE